MSNGSESFPTEIPLQTNEQARRQSEAQFRLLADAIPQIVWIADAEGRVEFFNRQWGAYTGAAYQPVTTAEVAAGFVHPDDAPATMQAFAEAQRSGTFNVEHRIRAADGGYRWFSVCAEPYRDGVGKIVRWFGVSTDIHDRREAWAALRATEARHEFLLQLGDALRVLADPVDMQATATQLLGEHLRVAQAGYGEVNEAQEQVVVCRDWNDGRLASVGGRWHMHDFGPRLIADLKQGRTVAIPDVTENGRTSAPGVVSAYHSIGIRAILDVPLIRAGRMVALLFIHHSERRAWSHDEIALVEESCERLWATLERARAERQP